MNLKKCEHGHFYDADKYASCPRCQTGAAPAAPEQHVPAAEAPAAAPEPKIPPTGWLVCTEGTNKGNVYELKSGANTIGGAAGLDICLGGAPQISKACQVAVTYDADARAFSASAGNARELSYVNGQVILVNVKLQSRDIIQIGGEKLLFIPLCGEDFAWEE